MENILMRFCRESNRYTPKVIATQLGIPIKTYKELEKGIQLLSRKQAAQLGKLYNTTGSWFYKESIQLDLLLTRVTIIETLKKDIEKLRQDSKQDRRIMQAGLPAVDAGRTACG